LRGEYVWPLKAGFIQRAWVVVITLLAALSYLWMFNVLAVASALLNMSIEGDSLA
jgi:hypothetical protein